MPGGVSISIAFDKTQVNYPLIDAAELGDLGHHPAQLFGFGACRH
jgi:hypothetical protein